MAKSLSVFVCLDQIWVHGLAVWMAFFVSLSFYPAVTVLVESENKGHRNAWNGKFHDNI